MTSGIPVTVGSGVSIAEKIGCVRQALHEPLKKIEVDSGKRNQLGGLAQGA